MNVNSMLTSVVPKRILFLVCQQIKKFSFSYYPNDGTRSPYKFDIDIILN